VGRRGDRILLIHGIGLYSESWMFNIEALGRHHRVIALDLAGCGRSDKPNSSYSYSFFAEFLADFMDALDIPKASLVGHSLGGGIARHFACFHPERVEKLILEDCSGWGREIHFGLRLSSVPLIGELMAAPDREAVIEGYRQCVHDPAIITDEIGEFAYQMVRYPGAGRAYLSILRAGVSFFGQKKRMYRSVMQNIDAITMPTLIVWGKEDPVIPVAHAYRAKEILSDARITVLEDCAHVPHCEYPEIFNELILDFLSEPG
jgi:4,5:9,10-diseco-3-hydroxy-5,9,17-trioxoandrosta-1(10),2-diene-4-oate hydrolase